MIAAEAPQTGDPSAGPAWRSQGLRLALALAFAFHGALLFSGSYRRTYDAFVHIFFADHYRRWWFDPWEPRWYTGFSVTSYPPGAHQAVALVSHLTGLANAFALVQLAAVLLAMVGIYRFARLWVDEEAAGYAAVLAVFASSIAETVHVFGQLPTMVALAFLLNALPSFAAWVKTGQWTALLTALAAFAAATATHHVTMIFGAIFFAGPVGIDAARSVARVRRLADPRPEPPFRRGSLVAAVLSQGQRCGPALVRLAIVVAGILVVIVTVIYPYWRWSSSDPITQLSIPHASRDSYIGNLNAGLIFWLVPWGLLVLALPVALYKGLTSRLWPLAASLGVLTLLGTGGTTPIPRIALGPAYEILTLDRFTFWATIVALPFAGLLVTSLRRGIVRQWLDRQFGAWGRAAIQTGLVIAYLGIAVFTVNLTHFRAFQPAAIDMAPIVSFMEKDEHWRWRYLALGFGDQLAWLSAQTAALTPDGNYHSARRLPELTSSPIERLEGAKYSGLPGIGSLQQMLAIPEKYNIKFVFSNDQFYDPLLAFSGWHQIARLENGIVVWQRDDVDPLPAQLPRRDFPAVERLMWGTLPIGSVIAALVLLSAGIWWPPLISRLGRHGIGVPRLPARGGRRIGRLGDRLDRWLLRHATVKPADRVPPLWERVRRQIPPVRPLSRPLRGLNLALVGLILLGIVGASGYVWLKPAPGPDTVVAAYYGHLDFRRFEEAYALLDPETRPPLDEFLLRLSVNGGLLASYARLDSIETMTVSQAGAIATVAADVNWVTSLGAHPATDIVTLRQRGANWYIDLPPDQPVPPSDEFFSAPEVAFQSLGRRDLSTGPTDPADILDRPELIVRSASLVRRDGIYSVVGELMNVDHLPADVTVTAVIYDADGRELTRYNAQTVMMHSLLPAEVTPFRIDFQGVAAGLEAGTQEPIEFEPDAAYPVDPAVWSDAASFQLIVKAVATTHGLDRSVSAQDVGVSGGPDSAAMTGLLVNTGVAEAIVPQVLVTFYDPSGAVAWVEQHILDDSIRSQRSRAFAFSITPFAEVNHVLPLGSLVVNGVPSELSGEPNAPVRFAMPPESGYASFRVSVNAFMGPGV